MFSTWRVSVVLNTINHTGGALASIASQAMGAEARMGKLSQTMAKIGPIASAAFLSAGAAFGAFAAKGIKDAADFETAMVTVGVATAATAGQYSALQQQIMKVSGATAQSATTIADEYAIFARAGFTADQTMKLMPQVARYADDQMLAFKANPVESVSKAAMFLHQEGAYTTQTAGPALEILHNLMYLQPESASKLVTQGKYFIGYARALGVSLGDTAKMLAELGITGYLSGKGGTGVAAIIRGGMNSPVMTSHGMNVQGKADSALGMLDAQGRPKFYNRQTNSFDFFGMVSHIADERKAYLARHEGDKFSNDVIGAFKTGASSLVQIISNPATIQQMRVIEEKSHHIPTIEENFQRYINTWNGLTQRLSTNWQNIMIDIFLPTLKVLEPYVAAFNKQVSNLGDLLSRNPQLGRKIGLTIMGLAATLTAAGAILGVMSLRAVSSIANLNGSILALADSSADAATQTRRAALANAAESSLPNVVPGTTSGVIRTEETIRRDAFKTAPLIENSAKSGGMLRELGQLGNALNVAFGGAWLMRVTGLGRAFSWIPTVASGALRLLGAINPVAGTIALITSAFLVLYAAVKHPVQFGQFVANVQNWFQYKMWPAVTGAFTSGLNVVTKSVSSFISGPGSDAITGAFSGLIGDVVAIISNAAGTVAKIAGDINDLRFSDALKDLQHGQMRGDHLNAKTGRDLHHEQLKNDHINATRRGAYDKVRQQGAQQYQHAAAAHRTSFVPPSRSSTSNAHTVAVTNNIGDIHVHADKNPHKTAQAVVHEINRRTAFNQRVNAGSTGSPRVAALSLRNGTG